MLNIEIKIPFAFHFKSEWSKGSEFHFLSLMKHDCSKCFYIGIMIMGFGFIKKNIEMKKCSTCEESKKLEEFYRDKRTSDGLYSNCKNCFRAMAKFWRSEKQDKTKLLKYLKDWRNKNRESIRNYFRNYMAEYRQRIKEKTRARNKVNNMIYSGKLEKGSCENCGAIKSEAHHENYNEPLKINWFCKTCHEKHHVNLSKEL